MYSYGSSARAGGGKRGHGGRPYRPPPDRSKKDAAPPPLKQCDCLIELDLPEYATPVDVGGGRTHAAFGSSREAVERTVRIVRTRFQCHLQIPGRNQGKAVALVASSLEDAIPACHHVMQQIVTVTPGVTARIHRDVKAHLPVISGTLYRVHSTVTNPVGRLFVQDTSTAEPGGWAVAVYTAMSPDPVTEMRQLQTCLDNLRFCGDASCDYRLVTSLEKNNATLFAMASQASIDKLLEEIRQTMVLPEGHDTHAEHE